MWTRLCVYGGVIAKSGLRGGPLDSALNATSRKLPTNYACPAVARAPTVVVLTYPTAVRYVALDMGGCPAVVLHNGARRTLRLWAARTILRYWAATIRPRWPASSSPAPQTVWVGQLR